jgi:hypothetical protein
VLRGLGVSPRVIVILWPVRVHRVVSSPAAPTGTHVVINIRSVGTMSLGRIPRPGPVTMSSGGFRGILRAIEPTI